ncbi:MAG: PAS domain-containing protein [Stellaceae bacterium]
MPPSPIPDERIRQAYDYWLGKAAGRAMPRRGNLDPIEIPLLLPNIMLVDVEEPRRFRYRLIGTDCAQSHGFDATGRYVDEVLLDADYRGFVIALYDACVVGRRPIYSETLFASARTGTAGRRVHVAFMPLSEDGERVNMVFVAQHVSFPDRMMRDRHLLEASPFKEVAHRVL